MAMLAKKSSVSTDYQGKKRVLANPIPATIVGGLCQALYTKAGFDNYHYEHTYLSHLSIRDTGSPRLEDSYLLMFKEMITSILVKECNSLAATQHRELARASVTQPMDVTPFWRLTRKIIEELYSLMHGWKREQQLLSQFRFLESPDNLYGYIAGRKAHNVEALFPVKAVEFSAMTICTRGKLWFSKFCDVHSSFNRALELMNESKSLVKSLVSVKNNLLDDCPPEGLLTIIKSHALAMQYESALHNLKSSHDAYGAIQVLDSRILGNPEKMTIESFVNEQEFHPTVIKSFVNHYHSTITEESTKHATLIQKLAGKEKQQFDSTMTEILTTPDLACTIGLACIQKSSNVRKETRSINSLPIAVQSALRTRLTWFYPAYSNFLKKLRSNFKIKFMVDKNKWDEAKKAYENASKMPTAEAQKVFRMNAKMDLATFSEIEGTLTYYDQLTASFLDYVELEYNRIRDLDIIRKLQLLEWTGLCDVQNVGYEDYLALREKKATNEEIVKKLAGVSDADLLITAFDKNFGKLLKPILFELMASEEVLTYLWSEIVRDLFEWSNEKVLDKLFDLILMEAKVPDIDSKIILQRTRDAEAEARLGGKKGQRKCLGTNEYDDLLFVVIMMKEINPDGSVNASFSYPDVLFKPEAAMEKDDAEAFNAENATDGKQDKPCNSKEANKSSRDESAPDVSIKSGSDKSLKKNKKKKSQASPAGSSENVSKKSTEDLASTKEEKKQRQYSFTFSLFNKECGPLIFPGSDITKPYKRVTVKAKEFKLTSLKDANFNSELREAIKTVEELIGHNKLNTCYLAGGHPAMTNMFFKLLTSLEISAFNISIVDEYKVAEIMAKACVQTMSLDTKADMDEFLASCFIQTQLFPLKGLINCFYHTLPFVGDNQVFLWPITTPGLVDNLVPGLSRCAPDAIIIKAALGIQACLLYSSGEYVDNLISSFRKGSIWTSYYMYLLTMLGTTSRRGTIQVYTVVGSADATEFENIESKDEFLTKLGLFPEGNELLGCFFRVTPAKALNKLDSCIMMISDILNLVNDIDESSMLMDPRKAEAKIEEIYYSGTGDDRLKMLEKFLPPASSYKQSIARLSRLVSPHGSPSVYSNRVINNFNNLYSHDGADCVRDECVIRFDVQHLFSFFKTRLLASHPFFDGPIHERIMAGLSKGKEQTVRNLSLYILLKQVFFSHLVFRTKKFLVKSLDEKPNCTILWKDGIRFHSNLFANAQFIPSSAKKEDYLNPFGMGMVVAVNPTYAWHIQKKPRSGDGIYSDGAQPYDGEFKPLPKSDGLFDGRSEPALIPLALKVLRAGIFYSNKDHLFVEPNSVLNNKESIGVVESEPQLILPCGTKIADVANGKIPFHLGKYQKSIVGIDYWDPVFVGKDP